ncbi:ribonuclease P protein component [Georgenia sp. TF02-10]|uniref:ribonuclease P protein component n=1 Tax=Georgenia sp. TF02-10 TaxID=2917725 RepID=UPI00352E6270
MRRSSDFDDAVRRGARGGTRRLVVHLAAGTDETTTSDRPALVGFVVPKAVGGAVQRNQVKRRLRAVLAARVVALPAGARVVVRALPDAAGATFQQLASDVDAALAAARRRSARAARTRGAA